MSFDDYNMLKKKRNNGISSNPLGANHSMSLNENSFVQ